MREILFKAKRISDGKWIEGSLIVYSDQTTGIVYDIGDIEGMRKEVVRPETVCQYTGLTDRNGKKIFEGDIVTTDLQRPYLIVEFRNACFMFNCNDGNKDYYDIFMPITDVAYEEYRYGEVIGNIHDGEGGQHGQ